MLYLNGRKLRLRGASIHEDDIRTGAALTPGSRSLLVSRLRDLGATRHPGALPAPPRVPRGLRPARDPLLGSGSGVPARLTPCSTCRACAARPPERSKLTVANNVSHPSVLAWSLVNEPASSRPELGQIGRGLQTYIREAATAARQIDDTRLIAIDRHSRIGEPLSSPAYRYLDALGVNEYFGWYDSVRAGPARSSTTEQLGPYLDELHRANPSLPLVITEFGAEASRHGARDSARHLRVPDQVRDRPPAHPRLEAPTWPGRSRGRCATSGSRPAGRAAPRSSTPPPPGTTRA